MLEVVLIPVLSDNYLWLVHEPESGCTAAVDPAVAEPVLAMLKKKGWRLTHILNTHHHYDHVGANLELKAATGCAIAGYGPDAARIPGIDIMLYDGDAITLGQAEFKVLFMPGHTKGHIAYWYEKERWLFCGDTLFSLGCGRLFEGTAEEMYGSLERIRALPEESRIACAHEYTESNARFALTLEPQNEALQQRVQEVKALRAQAIPTLPTTVGLEKKTNPFLRTESVEIRQNLGMVKALPVEVFAEIRRRKDVF